MAPRTPVRRILAALGAAAVGVAATLAVATPASAHAVSIKASHDCDAETGEWIVHWKVFNDYPNDATIDELVSTPATPIEGIEVGSVIPKFKNGEDGKLKGDQRVPGSTTEVTLSVKAKWKKDQFTNSGSHTEKFKGETCQPTPKCVDASQAAFEHTFDKAGKATVSYTGKLPLCENVKQPFSLASYFTPSENFAVPQFLYQSDTKTITRETTSVDLTVDIPDCFTQIDLVWGDKVIGEITETGDRYGNLKLGSNGPPGNRSKGPQGWYNGVGKSGKPQACSKPAAEFLSECNGDVKVQLTNDNTNKDAKYAIKYVVTDASGATQEITVKPGDVENVLVKADVASKITVTADGKDVASGAWERPLDCAPPTLTIKGDCDTITLTLTNPEGNVAADANVTYGAETKTVTVAAGKTETVTFKAGDAEKVSAVFGELDLTLDAVYTKPAACVAPPGLPVTGSNVGGIIGASAAAVALGGFLFWRFRRRRVTFSA